MRVIKGPTVTQVRIFPQDWIPYSDLAIRENFLEFKEKFSFSKEEIPFPLYKADAPKIMIFSGGSITLGNKPFLIPSLTLEERKITLVIEAASDKADSAFDKIARELEKIDKYKNFVPTGYVIKTEKTECVVQLNVNYHRFFSRQFNVFINKQLPKYTERKTRKVMLKRFSFEILFEQDDKLQEELISIAPKLFTIEPRKTTKEEEGIFYTVSPCDSFTHLNILEKLEEIFRSE